MSEEEYYQLVKRAFAKLAPFYGIISSPLWKLRGRAADFLGAEKGAKVLDVGTGTGAQAFAFAKRGYDVTGIDLSKAMLGIAIKRNKYKNLRFRIADATALPFEAGSFDVTSASFVLHDMPHSIREKTLKEMVRVTKPGGLVLIVEYSLPRNKLWKSIVYNFVSLYESDYYIEFIKSDFEGLLANLGIEVEARKPALMGVARILKGRRK